MCIENGASGITAGYIIVRQEIDRELAGRGPVYMTSVMQKPGIALTTITVSPVFRISGVSPSAQAVRTNAPATPRKFSTGS